MKIILVYIHLPFPILNSSFQSNIKRTSGGKPKNLYNRNQRYVLCTASCNVGKYNNLSLLLFSIYQHLRTQIYAVNASFDPSPSVDFPPKLYLEK